MVEIISNQIVKKVTLTYEYFLNAMIGVRIRTITTKVTRDILLVAVSSLLLNI